MEGKILTKVCDISAKTKIILENLFKLDDKCCLSS